MNAQPSNQAALLEGALTCLARLPIDRISARVLADESGANLASIGYHFGSKEGLMTAAVVEGLDRWLERIDERLASVDGTVGPAERLLQALRAVDATRADYEVIARAFVVALARGHHDHDVAERLVEGFLHTRPRVASLLGLGDDDVGTDAGGVVHAMFTGLLVQSLLGQELLIDGDRVMTALHRITEIIGPSSPIPK